MLALVMFLNGLAVMVLEMVGARLLAPWLGTSVVVWTSLIGVILASLSLGYWLGGRLADTTLLSTPERTAGKKDKHSTENEALRRAHSILSRLLTLAATLVLCTAFAQSFTLQFLAKAVSSLHVAAVLAALALFAAPSVLCGMVSPYAMRLAIGNSPRAGAVIGRLTALSTIGSIAGTFLGGFILISWFGSTEITIGVAACLLLAGVLAHPRPMLPKVALFLLICLGAVANYSYGNYQTAQGDITVETPYNTMRVQAGPMENRQARFLMTDPGSCQSGMFLDDPTELAFPYTRFYALGTALRPDARRVLMLGGGGYSVPKWLLSGRSGLAPENLNLDVVELDPGVTKVARAYFKLPENDARMRVFHEDARAFLNRAADKVQGEYGEYQLIFGDVFNSYYTVPFHVGTREAARNIRALLDKDGVFVMNIITAIEGDNGRLLRAVYHAFTAEFGQVSVFPVHAPQNGSSLQNVMLLAFRTPRALPEADLGGPYARVAHMLGQRWTKPIPEDVPPLTDNYAPVERYTLGYH